MPRAVATTAMAIVAGWERPELEEVLVLVSMAPLDPVGLAVLEVCCCLVLLPPLVDRTDVEGWAALLPMGTLTVRVPTAWLSYTHALE
jgi:hypothetical protein